MVTSKKIVLTSAVAVIILGIIFFFLLPKKVALKISMPMQEVNLRLKWLNQAQFAGNYVASERGFYADAGLKVNMIPFSYGGNSPIEAVAGGKADFGIAGADEILLAREKGIPVKAIAVIYKINPVCAYTLKKSGITKPQDFIGKTIGIERGQNVEYLYYAMMGRLGLDRSKIKEISIGYDASELLSGKTDVSTGYIINEPELVVEAGQEVNTILAADYGVNMYADVLFSSEETIKSKPDLVQKFLKATLDGWQYAVENESEAVTATLKFATSSLATHEAYMLHASIPLINTGSSVLGWMDQEHWDAAQNILLEQKILTVKVNTADAYTMDFLNKIYNK